jgi:hypothetical protein
MSNVFFNILQDETIRIEVGTDVAAGLAVENIELTTAILSQAVRASVISRRAEPRHRSRNELSMYEVRLPVSIPVSADLRAA